MRNLGNFISASSKAEWIDLSCALISACIEDTLSEEPACYIALSGGNTPKAIFESLIAKEFLSTEQWQKVHFFWVDERLVEQSSDESNYGNALNYLSALPAHFYPMYNAELGEAASLEKYRKDLQQVPQFDQLPEFDLVLLGMGEDGHTASLFPQSPGLKEDKEAVIIHEIPSLQKKRMTLSFPVINQAKEIFIILNGASKIKIMQEILEKQTAYPIERVLDGTNPKTWIYCN